jgi:hypothetical protein
MTPMGQIRKSGRATGPSALPSRTDVASRACQVRKVPNSDIAHGAADPLHCEDTRSNINQHIGSIPDATVRLMSKPTTTGAPIIMAAPMPPVAPHDCTRGSTYGCTAAAAHGTSDDCTGNRTAARRTPARPSGAEHRCDPGE